jgi:hypothetical protein
MPLARIITHSHSCSRELALDLLARGYTVEIVSPDKVPDSIADLELRVDAAPGDQLIASVQANNGNSKASLDFVHHLRAPMADFKRRPMAAEPSLPDTAAVITPAVKAPHPVPKAVSASAKIVHRPESELLESEAKKEEVGEEERETISGSIPAVTIAVPSPTQTSTPIQSTSIQSTSFQSTAAAPPKRQREHYHLPDFVRHLPLSVPNLKINSWRASVALASVAMLVAVLWFGFRQTGKPSQASVAVPVEQAKSNGANSPKSNDQKSNDQQIASQATNGIPVAGSATTATSTAHQPRAHETGDYVARDTVVYLDKHYAEQAAAKRTQARRSKERPATSAKIRDGVIAANSVTYLNGKQPPKPAPKPQSSSN